MQWLYRTYIVFPPSSFTCIQYLVTHTMRFLNLGQNLKNSYKLAMGKFKIIKAIQFFIHVHKLKWIFKLLSLSMSLLDL